MSSNLASITKLKTGQIHANSMSYLKDRNQIFIAHQKGLVVYDLKSTKFQEIKFGDVCKGPISCVTTSDELLFFCSGSKVYAMASNLKIIFDFDTYLAVDRIQNIFVHGYRVFLVSSYMINEFLIGGNQLMNKKSRMTTSTTTKSQDVSEHIFQAKINSSLFLKPMMQKPFLLLLKSSNQIETFQKKQSFFVFSTRSPPTYACFYPQNQENQNKILVGTMNGQILYLEVNRKQIKLIWEIKENTKGKINFINQIKNGFFVAKDKAIQFWNTNKEIIGNEQIQQKITSGIYISSQQTLLFGTLGGFVIQMVDYLKSLAQGKKKSEKQQREELLKDIQALKVKKQLLLDKLKIKKSKLKTTSQNAVKKHIIKNSISIDYQRLCYNLQISSSEKICKLMLKGAFQVLQDNQNLFFSGKVEGQGVYILRYQNLNQIQVKIKYPQVYCQLQKMEVLAYFSYQSQVNNFQIDLKQLSLHHKVQSNVFDTKNKNLNKLQVQGNFKYFQLNLWLNSLFNQFGSWPNEVDDMARSCYESIITKNKLLIQYKSNLCIILAQSAIPLLLIKKQLLKKSKEKGISLSFQTKVTKQSVQQFMVNVDNDMQNFIKNSKEYHLLPGLVELKGDNLSADLLSILDRSQQIRLKFKQNERMLQQLKQKIVELYKSYKYLNNKQVNPFQEKQIQKSLQKWDKNKIIQTICH